jgi:hypothetical protein
MSLSAALYIIYGAGLPVFLSAANDMSGFVAHNLSGFVAHNLSGLLWSPLEVTNAMDRDATGDPEDAI